MLVLAFDIERTGATDEQDTIAIGASVVDEKYKELDSLLLVGFRIEPFNKEPSLFEKRCWDEHWSKDEINDLLSTKFHYDGKLSKGEREKEMITSFQAFRKKWEDYAEKNNTYLLLVSDNNVYDGGFINELIFNHLPKTLPIPFSASGRYSAFLETESVAKGLLMAKDSGYTCMWGAMDRLKKLYLFPTKVKEHDHSPENDAYSIAVDMQTMFGIQKNKVFMRIV